MVDVAGVPNFTELDEYPGSIPMLQNGWRPTGGPVNPEADQGLLNWPLRDLTNRTNYLYQRHVERKLEASRTVTVGPGGQYATLNAALERLSLMTPRLQARPVTCTVRLLDGYEMAEQVIVRGLSFGWVTIVSDASLVLIRRTSLIQGVDDALCAFGAMSGGVLPVIGALFSMTNEGPANQRCGVVASQGGVATVLPGCGIQSAGYYGMLASQGGSILAEGADFRNAQHDAARATRGGFIAARVANLSGASSTGAVAHRSGTVDCEEANISGAGVYGVFCANNGRANVRAANCRRGAADSTADIYVAAGGIVAAVGATGGTNIAVNTVTSTGIIMK